MIFKSFGYIKREIEQTDTLIREMGYTDVIQFLPPNGKKLILLPYYLKHKDRSTILWDIEPNSFGEVNTSSENISHYVIDNVKPGSIILLHPMQDEKSITINSIEQIIEGLKSKGYTFVTVNELIKLSK